MSNLSETPGFGGARRTLGDVTSVEGARVAEAAYGVQTRRSRMTNRHNLARIAPLAGAMVVLFGCFGTHGRDDEEGARRDAGTLPEPDAGGTAPVDAGTTVPPACGTTADIEVSIETLGLRECAAGRYEGAWLYAIDSVPSGVRLSIDLCPLADDDCRCAVTVTGIDERAASEIRLPGASGEVAVVLHEQGVLVESHDPSCPMDDFSCVRYPVLAAASGMLESPPVDPSAIDLAWGDDICSAPAPDVGPDCSRSSFGVVLTAWVSGFPGPIGTEMSFAPGETRSIDELGTVFQLARAGMTSCPDTRVARTAAWALWRAL